MNTREREVMDALATALRDARDSVAGELAHERAAFKGYEGSSNIAQLEAELVAIDSALAAYDALLAEGSAEKCFCDEKYPDSNRAATCGDCPRDYKGSASGEGTEAVAWISYDDLLTLQSKENNVIACCHPDPALSVALYTHPQPAQGDCGCYAETSYANGIDETTTRRCAKHAQGEHEQRSCEGSDWNEARFEATYNAVSNTIEGSERRPIADEVRDALNSLRRRLANDTPAWKDLCVVISALESALPRGLPAGSEVELDVHLTDQNTVCVDAQHGTKRQFSIGVTADGEVWFAAYIDGDRYNGKLGKHAFAQAIRSAYDEEMAERTLATAEQPSCGQDARDGWQPKGGTDEVSNLSISHHACNQARGDAMP